MNETKRPEFLVGLIGKARSGKTTLATYLADRWGFEVVGIADPLKTAVETALRQFPPPDHPKAADSVWENRTPFTRWLLQWVGTDLLRAFELNTLLVDLARDRLTRRSRLWVVVPDVRYPEEAELIRELGGTIWLVERSGATEPIEYGANHASEQGPTVIRPDRVLQNPEGRPEVMFREAAEIVIRETSR